MIKGRSYTALGVVASFSLVVMFIVVARQVNEARISRARRSALHEPAANAEQSRQPRDTTARYTCASNTSAAFDSDGKPCIDLARASRQGIYAVTTKNLSYLYCSIPKNGCTYHLGIMQRLLGFDYDAAPSVHQTDNRGRLYVDPQDLHRMLLDPNVEKYMVVRNPLERLLSAYFDKVERHLPANKGRPAAFERWVYEQFKPGTNWTGSVNPHWRQQMSFCGFSMRDLWKRFRWFTVERPVEYVDYLEEFLPDWVTRDGWNGADNTSLRESVLGPRKRTGNTAERFYRYVPTVKLFDHLVKVYEADIEGLGYQKEIAAMRNELLSRTGGKEES